MSDLINKSEYGKAIGLKTEMIRAKIDNCRNHFLAQSVMNDWESEIKGLYDALIILDDAPTIDAEPVRHGHWIKPTVIDGRAFNIPHCSVCNEVPCGVDEHTNYCPNCGAKMDEETTE